MVELMSCIDGSCLSDYKYIEIDFTFRCSLKCPLCLRQVEPNSLQNRTDISLKNLEKICKFFKSQSWCGQFSDCIYHRKFHDCQYIANEYDVGYVVHTNGNGRNDKWWNKTFDLTPKKSTWQFALDGLKHNAHIYRIGTDFDRVLDVMKLGKRKNVRIIWQYIIFPYNKKDIAEAKKISDGEGFIFKTIQNNGNNEFGIEK